jgi:ribosome biogenesis GTPase / thiamine phosphate phosphatase
LRWILLSDSSLSEGKIIKGIGGFYYLLDKGGEVHECRARGRFRKDGITPLVGDNARFSSRGLIEEILPRRNELERPRVANIDMAAIVVSAVKPLIDYMLCDKLLVSIKKEGIEPLIIINKCDIAEDTHINSIKREYGKACKTVCVSAITSEGINALRDILSGINTCFAGQSAAGKSSILNSLFTGMNLDTGGLSKKIERGMHTTRQAQLLTSYGFSGTVVDTPGFSYFDAADIEPEELCGYYDDMAEFTEGCRFRQCLHSDEPGCGVKDAVKKGLISVTRYQRYLEILKEIEEKRSCRYD